MCYNFQFDEHKCYAQKGDNSILTLEKLQTGFHTANHIYLGATHKWMRICYIVIATRLGIINDESSVLKVKCIIMYLF